MIVSLLYFTLGTVEDHEGWTYFNHTDLDYKFFKSDSEITWLEAQANCSSFQVINEAIFWSLEVTTLLIGITSTDWG